MSDAERDKWDERYRTGSYEARTHPTQLLVDSLSTLPRGRALDVACGAGRNALFLAERGYTVTGIDVSAVALERARVTAGERGLTVDWIQTDLETGALPELQYDLIVLVRYTDPGLIARLAEKLDYGGYLLCEEHLETNRDVVGPKRGPFRLPANALLRMAQGLRVIYYREGLIEDPDGRTAALAQLIACRGDAGF